MKGEAAWRWDAATNRLGVARRIASVCWWNGVVTDVATLALWLDQAKLVTDAGLVLSAQQKGDQGRQ
jgi:hypothetical protein